MEVKIYRLLLAALLLGGAGYYFLIYHGKPDEDTHQTSSIPSALDERVFHWRYNIGWDFRVQMTADGIY